MSKEAETAGTGSLLDQYQQRGRERRQMAAEEYRQILLRSDNPQSGDAECIEVLMQQLGRSAADLPDDIALVTRLGEAVAAEARLEPLAVKLKETRVAVREIEAWAAEQRTRLEEKIAERAVVARKTEGAAQGDYQAAAGVAANAVTLRRRWAAICEGVSVTE